LLVWGRGISVSTPQNAEPEDADAAEPKPMQQYHIELPPPLLHTESQQVLWEENQMLWQIIHQAGGVLERDYTQMKLMDLENKHLHEKAFAKDQWKAARQKLTSGQACHMTAPKMMDFLAWQTWKSAMGNLFKESSEQFKAQREAIDDHHKALAAKCKLADQE